MKTRFSPTLLALLLAVGAADGQEPQTPAKSSYVPRYGEFPPPGVGVYLAGELVAVDHVNRRGAIRLVGDGVDDRYHAAPSHEFALLPYGTIRYHGAPAELRDVPIGTLLHGYFVLPPVEETPKPAAPKARGKKPTGAEIRAKRYFVPYTHAISLEDDFSFYQRRGRAWKITAVDREKGKIAATATGPAEGDGLKGDQAFHFDASTRVWVGRQIGTLDDLAAGQVVQMSFTWDPEWKNGQLHVADVWVDEKGRATATELQRQIHIRYQRHHWLAGWIDHVEHQGGGKGIVTVTLFGGMDPWLYEQAKAQTKPGGGAAIATAEPTLRTWWQDHDSKSGSILDLKEDSSPPTGSSGLTFRVQIRELLEGYRPGRIVRFRPNGFPNVKLPPEERIKDLEDR